MILVTGASGNVGAYVTRRLLARGHEVRCFFRPQSSRRLLQGLAVDGVPGDLKDANSVLEACHGVDAVVHIAYVTLAEGIVEAVQRLGIPRVILLSSAGVHTRLPSPGAEAKRRAESFVANSGIPFTLLRPTMIYGNENDRNIFRLLRFIKRYRVFPLVGSGQALVQPVYLEDVAAAVVDVLEHAATIGKTYDLGGGQKLPLVELVRTAARALGIRVWPMRVPQSLARWGVRVAGGVLGLREEQVLRLNEDKQVDWSPATRDFGFRPLPFSAGVRLQIEHCRELGLL